MKRKILLVMLIFIMVITSTVTVTANTEASSAESSMKLNTVITEKPFVTDNIVGTLKVMENDIFTRAVLYDDTTKIVVDITYFHNSGELLDNLTQEKVNIGDAAAVSPPPGVTFGEDREYKGTYEMTGIAISIEAALICAALGLPSGTALVVSMVTIAVSLGLSHVYWTKKVAYGQDSQYIYVRTKTQFYQNSARTKKVGKEIVTYQKKAKGGTVAIEPEII